MSIREIGPGVWQLRIYNGMMDGDRLFTYYTYKGDRRGAEKEELRLRAAYGLLPRNNDPNLTVMAYLTRWLCDYVKPFQSAATYNCYRHNIEHRMKPHIADIKLRELTPAYIQRMYKAISGMKKPNGEILSPSTVNMCHRVLHTALKQAVLEGLISSNPCDICKPPSPAKFNPVLINAEDVQRFLEASSQSQYYALFAVTLFTGMRLGECLGLIWDDVNLEEGMITIKRSLKYPAGQEPFLAEPKTRSSYRTIILPKIAVDILKEHRIVIFEEKLKMGPDYRDLNLVFPSSTGGFLTPSNISRRSLRIVCEKAGLKPLRFHDLRHSHATMMANARFSARAISDRLGHSSPAFSMERYTHGTDHAQYETAAYFDKEFGDNNPLKIVPNSQ